MCKTTEEQNFEELIKDLSQNHDWNTTYNYIASGLAESRNYGGELTPKIFHDHFYVSSEQHDEIKNNILNGTTNLTNNVLILTAHGGSGKSVFVHMLPYFWDTETKSNTINGDKILEVDFETIGDMRWYEKLLNAIKSFLDNDNKGDKEIKNKNAFTKIFIDFLDKCLNKEYKMNKLNSMLNISNILNDVKTAINNTFEVYNNIHYVFSTDVINPKYFIPEHMTSTISGVMLLLTLYIISKEVYLLENSQTITSPIYSKLSNKYFMIFDNVEVFDSVNVKEITKIIKTALNLIQEKLLLIDRKGYLCDYFRKCIKFICAMRTSTFNLTYETLHDGSTTTPDPYDVIELPYCSIFQQAILKKYNYLKQLDLQKSALYKNVELIIHFIFNKDAIQHNAKNKPGHEKEIVELNSNKALKLFVENNYVAFFNNDIRRSIYNLTTVFQQQYNFEIIRNLLNTKNKDDLNGARQIIFRQVFDRINQNVFSSFGFEEIDPLGGENKSSVTRLILAYLKWQKIAHPARDVTLKQLLDQVFYLKKNTPVIYETEKIADWIYTASNVVASRPLNLNITKDANHYDLISKKWSSLIKFSENLTKESLIDCITTFPSVDKKENLRVNNIPITHIKVSLTDAGKCVIDYVSVQFEFFSSRLNQNFKPLYCYIKSSDSENELKECLNSVYLAIKHYITGMLTTCPCYYNIKTPFYDGLCPYKNMSTKESQKDMIDCGYFMRLQETLAILRQTISYIDRYRLFVIRKNVNSNEIEQIILENIKKYSECYDFINKHDFLRDHVEIINKSHLNTSNNYLRQYYKKINEEHHSHEVDGINFYYYKTPNGEICDLLKLAINTRMEHLNKRTGDKTATKLSDIIFNAKQNNKLSLYELCKKIQSTLNNQE